LESNLLFGLSLAVTGLIITFLSLGLFGVLIALLSTIFPYKPPMEETTPAAEAAPASIELESPISADEEIPVVIAAALSYCLSKSHSSLGNALAEGKSGWWFANRIKSQQGLAVKIMRSGR
jgi:Na+-transporting methylmalonyl-CoA/oxaloacetate decarboxylase gamma subunit